MSERVLAIPAKYIENLWGKDDFTIWDDWKDSCGQYHLDLLFRLIDGEAYFMDRDEELENNELILQIIPYCVVTYFDRYTEDIFYMTYRRLSRSGEDRLKGKVSIGIGGHINDEGMIIHLSEPGVRQNVFANGAHRELLEETNIKDILRKQLHLSSFYPIGFLRSRRSEVGKVHFCVICRLNLDISDEDILGEIQMTETDVAEKIGWFTAKELLEKDGTEFELEDWSKIILNKSDESDEFYE